MSVLLHFCGQYHGGNAHGNDGHVVLTTHPCGRHAGGGDGGDDGAIKNNMNNTNTTANNNCDLCCCSYALSGRAAGHVCRIRVRDNVAVCSGWCVRSGVVLGNARASSRWQRDAGSLADCTTSRMS